MNDGSDNFTVNIIPETLLWPSDIEVADLDGDNDKDLILAFTSSGEVVWFDNDGSRIFYRKRYCR